MSKKQTLAAFIIFILIAAGIAAFVYWPFSEKISQERHPTRIIIPGAADSLNNESGLMENDLYEDSFRLKAPLGDGEFAISILNVDLTGNAIEEQFVVYRSISDTENPISVAYFGFNERSGIYQRMWNADIAAAMPGTVSMYTQDLLGDRSFCVIITGMNTLGEHTMTVFRRDPQDEREGFFSKIAEIKMSGSITVQETDRSLAYQQGIARGQPFIIAASGHDSESENILDRIDLSYTYNARSGVYEQSSINRTAGTQIEARRLREILGGGSKAFEEFINDLWYHVSPSGTIDKSQYIFFDPEKREIIFFGDETQQVFNWQSSNSSRYGLYIASQNISVSTLRRFLDIEMESLDSIRMKVFEDVRLKIGVSASWDGSYRRAGTAMLAQTEDKAIRPYTDAVYDSSMGRLRFYANGEYELSSSGVLTKGRYAFFRVGAHELLELRPERNTARSDNTDNRFIYTLSSMETGEKDSVPKNDNLSLARVRLGASGIHELHEIPIILTRSQ